MHNSPPRQLADVENIALENPDTPQLNARTLAQRRRRERERASRSLAEMPELVNASLSPSSENRRTAQRMRRQNEMVTRQRLEIVVEHQPEAIITTNEHTHLSKRARFNSSVYEEGESSNRSPNTFVSTVSESTSPTPPFVESIPTETLVRHYLGLMDVECSHCKALHWLDEKLVNSRGNTPLFGTCCLQGKIRLPQLREPPLSLKALYDGTDDKSKAFRGNIRRYNASNAFTSLGCNLERRNFNGQGPVSFTIHGELRHRTGSLIPEEGTTPSYAQLYIYDPSRALNIRSR